MEKHPEGDFQTLIDQLKGALTSEIYVMYVTTLQLSKEAQGCKDG